MAVSYTHLDVYKRQLLLYNAPVPVESMICKTCFKDRQVAFAVWRILFDKKVIIQKMDAKGE